MRELTHLLNDKDLIRFGEIALGMSESFRNNIIIIQQEIRRAAESNNTAMFNSLSMLYKHITNVQSTYNLFLIKEVLRD